MGVRDQIWIMSAVIVSVVCVLGVVGNGVVIWVTAFRMKRTVSTVWYLNLAVADFLVTASLPLQITKYALVRWPFGWFMCKMDGVFFHMNMYSSIYTLVVISVDRCVCGVSGVHPEPPQHQECILGQCGSLAAGPGSLHP